VVSHPQGIGNLLNIQGIVQRIDLIDRSMAVAVDTSQLLFDVSPACLIWLNGERVKLRMLQAGDGLRVSYRESPPGRMALSLDARTRSALPAQAS
jgi:hypothetical protein